MKKYTLVIGLLLLVAYINCGGNNAPVIGSITFNPTAPMVGEDVTCTVTATDEDDDTLTFTWSADGGTFASTTGDSVTWTAPTPTASVDSAYGENNTTYPINDSVLTVSTIDIATANAGTYTITVIASDESDADTLSATLTVAAAVDSLTLITNIIHLWTQNLDITLIAPDSTSALLYDNTYPAASSDTLTTAALAGTPVSGTWELHIFDEVPLDEGNLNSWNMTIYYQTE